MMYSFFARLLHRESRTEIQNAVDGHNGISEAALSAMSNGELARWHANHKNDVAKNILASEEWDNRRLRKQIRANLFNALIGLSGGLLGVLLGWYLRGLDAARIDHENRGLRASSNQHQTQHPTAVERKTIEVPRRNGAKGNE